MTGAVYYFDAVYNRYVASYQICIVENHGDPDYHTHSHSKV